MDPHLGVMKTKAKINKWDIIKLKNLFTAKETIKKKKKKDNLQNGKIFAKNDTNKELISKIYKQLIQLNIKKKKTQLKKKGHKTFL